MDAMNVLANKVNLDHHTCSINFVGLFCTIMPLPLEQMLQGIFLPRSK